MFGTVASKGSMAEFPCRPNKNIVCFLFWPKHYYHDPARRTVNILAPTLFKKILVSTLGGRLATHEDLDLNVCGVDVPGAAGKNLDLVCYFTGKQNYGCAGRVWVELKAWGLTKFDGEAEKFRNTAPARLAVEQRRDSSLCGVLLLAAKVGRAGGGTWGKPVFSVIPAFICVQKSARSVAGASKEEGHL